MSDLFLIYSTVQNDVILEQTGGMFSAEVHNAVCSSTASFSFLLVLSGICFCA